MKPRLPATQQEFESVMEEIDQRLRDRGVSIADRYMPAALEYSRQYGVEIKLFSGNSAGAAGVYRGVDGDAHIRAWLESRYGDRQRGQYGLDSMVVLLRGDAWEAQVPRIYGVVRRVADRDLGRYSDSPSVAKLGDPDVVINVLAQMKSLPPTFAKQLTEAELQSALQQFECGLAGCNAVSRLNRLPLISEVEADLGAAVRHMVATPPHFGQARYSASQAAEKLLKCVLRSTQAAQLPGGTPPGREEGHNIQKLAERAAERGMVMLHQSVISCASAKAGMRYGELPVSLVAAVDAQNAAFAVAHSVFQFLKPTKH